MKGTLHTPRKIRPGLFVGLLLIGLIGLCTSPAPARAQSANKKEIITLRLTGATIREAFKAIEAQSEYKFIYNEEEVPREYRANFISSGSITQVLNDVLQGLPLGYEIRQKSIIIKPALPTAPQEKAAPKRITIRGHITDELGSPLAGAIVIVDSRKTGVAANANGDFEMEIFDFDVNRDQLVFRYLGLQPEYVDITARTVYNVMLKSAAPLEEVMITGYQTISAERATGSFDIVRGDLFDKPASSISNQLIGVVAGVHASMNEDGTATFQIRGQSTIDSNSDPLVVIDGFPVEGGLELVNPNDVESVTFLKDAASASIWGSRSGNGVIVITTKKATRNAKLSISASAFTRVRQKMDLDYVNPIASSADQLAYEEYIFQSGLCAGTVARPHFEKVYSAGLATLNELSLGHIDEAEKNRRFAELSKINYQDDVYKYLLRHPVSTQVNLSMSAGSEKASYNTSLLYENSKTHFVGSGSNRFSFNSNINADPFKWLTLDLGAYFQYDNEDSSGATLAEITSLSPYERLVNDDGSYTHIVKKYYMPAVESLPLDQFAYPDWFYNPLQDVRSRELTTKTMNTRLRAGLTFKILDGLSYTASLQFALSDAKSREYYGEENFTVKDLVNYNSAYNAATGTVGTLTYPEGGLLDRRQSESWNYVVRNQIAFNKGFGRHIVNAVAGIELSKLHMTSTNYPRAYGYNDKTLTTKTLSAAGSPTDIYGSSTLYKINSAYATSLSESNTKYFSAYINLSYTFDNKYTISGSARNDASNLITDDPKYRYSPFWSVGVMWNAKREGFLRSAEFLDRLDLRATFGHNGNANNRTSFMPLISLNPSSDPIKGETGSYISSHGNPTLRWERVKTWDAGVDMSFFKGKLTAKIDWYRKNSVDLIALVSMPALNGTTQQSINAGGMVNKGIEVTLGSSLRIAPQISWSGSLTYAYNKNEITKFFKTNYNYQTFSITPIYLEGHDINALYSFEYLGVNDEGVPCVRNFDGTPLPMYAVPNQTVDARNWLRESGVRIAPHVMGLRLGFRIYDFDISMTAVGKFGHVFRNTSYFEYDRTSSYKMIVHKDVSKILDGTYPIPDLPDKTDSRIANYATYLRLLDVNIHSANHIRFQEINLTYNLPSRIIRKIGLSRAAVYVQAENLGLIANNDLDVDPEFLPGSVTPERAFTFGLKLNF